MKINYGKATLTTFMPVIATQGTEQAQPKLTISVSRNSNRNHRRVRS